MDTEYNFSLGFKDNDEEDNRDAINSNKLLDQAYVYYAGDIDRKCYRK